MADYLNDFGNALVRAGDGRAGAPLFEEAVRIAEAAYGPESPRVATPLYNLGGAYAEQREWVRAAAPLDRAIRLWLNAYGPEDARVALAYSQWADVLAAGGRSAEAVAYYEKAIAVRVRAGERDHPQTASLEARLAQVLARLDRLTEAEQHAARAEAHLSRLAEWRDREYAEVVALRARLGLAVPERRAFALGRAADADAAMRRHVRSTVRFLGDRRALEYVGHRFAGRDAVLAYLAAHPRDGAAARTGLELVARSRNLVLDELASRAHGAVTGEGAAARERSARAAERLATLIYRGALAAGEASLREAQDEYDEAERAAALLAVRPPEPELPGDVVAALSERLPPGSALVSMCAYRPWSEPDGTAYLAFVLVPGAREPVVVPLGPAAPIDALVHAWQAALERLVREREAEAVREEVDRLGRELGAALWTPIARELRGATRAVLVPDGALNLVSFAALVDASGRYVLESGPTLHLVSGERDLLREVLSPREPSLLVVANPAFDDGSALSRSGATPSAAAPSPGASGGTRGGEPCDRLAALRFSALPASQGEADALRALWTRLRGEPPTLLAGSAAAEAALKRAAPGHSIVHVATHGFVVEPGCGSAPSGPGPRVSPLLLSGVALAGANRRRDASPAEDDGLLTAEEIAGLDLREADWVVLSACQTGRGEVSDSEGVLGLRRALAVAGARTVVMSLWAVADDDARQWMVDLYEARFADGLETPDAVRRASERALARVRAEDGVGDPSRWAAFVAAGW